MRLRRSGIKGWRLVSFHPRGPERVGVHEEWWYVSFAHYTGRRLLRGGCEHDKVLRGILHERDLLRALRKYLEPEPGLTRDMEVEIEQRQRDGHG